MDVRGISAVVPAEHRSTELPMMKIRIGGLSEGVHQYRFQAPASAIGLDAPFQGEVTVDASLDKSGTQFLLRAEVGALGRFVCDRCTGEFELPISTSYQMYYVMDGSEQVDIDPTELQVIPPGSNSIDIADDVRQVVLLAVPLKLLCSERCEGLCPYCGKNKNVERCACTASEADSRWEILRDLRSDD
jgi:uncharacterized protein